jgi:hypothetical protein
VSFRIGRWNCTYRVIESHPRALLAVDVLERRVRHAVLDAYEATLVEAFTNDPTVYVVRRLDVKLAMHVASEPNGPALARVWGARMGAEAVRVISAASDFANIVCFEDQADFIAHFLSDLLRDLAWQRWCYGAFARFRHTPRHETVLIVLREHSHLLAGIFRSLARLGSMCAVLDLLDGAAAAALWREAVRAPTREPDVAEFLLFIRAALHIIATLGLWNALPLDESELLAAYAATRPQPPNWTDRHALSAAVSSILRLTERLGHIAIPHEAEFEERWRMNTAELANALDWLDLDWLGKVLAARPQQAVPAPRTACNPHVSGATPNQARLLARLRQILTTANVPLDRADPDSESNALRIFAVLAAAEPEIVAQPATPSILKVLVAAWAAIERTADPIVALQQIRAGRVPSSLPDLTPGHLDALRSASALGAPAADVIHELMTKGPIALRAAAAEDDDIHTACAGLFLLVRAISEVRIAPPSPVLFALGLQWSGVRDNDLGLAFWSGLAQPEPATAVLKRLDPTVCDQLLVRVENILESRASIDRGSTLITDFGAEFTDVLTDHWPSDVPKQRSITTLSVHLLRLWSQWLRGFAKSSVPYLLRQFIRRAGTIEVRPNEIAVILRPSELDVVLEMSGYLSPTPPVAWLAHRRVSFRITGRHT